MIILLKCAYDDILELHIYIYVDVEMHWEVKKKCTKNIENSTLCVLILINNDI